MNCNNSVMKSKQRTFGHWYFRFIFRKTLADGECSQKPLPLGAIIVGSVCGVLLIAILTWSFTIWRSSGYNCSCQGDGTWGGFSAGGGGSDGGGGGGGGGGSGGGGGGFWLYQLVYTPTLYSGSAYRDQDVPQVPYFVVHTIVSTTHSKLFYFTSQFLPCNLLAMLY